jgi:hypothetical protein
MGCTARPSWEQLFFDPIELPDGRVLRSLCDAGEFIQSLPALIGAKGTCPSQRTR